MTAIVERRPWRIRAVRMPAVPVPDGEHLPASSAVLTLLTPPGARLTVRDSYDTEAAALKAAAAYAPNWPGFRFEIYRTY